LGLLALVLLTTNREFQPGSAVRSGVARLLGTATAVALAKIGGVSVTVEDLRGQVIAGAMATAMAW
jgi:hypothetical protein